MALRPQRTDLRQTEGCAAQIAGSGSTSPPTDRADLPRSWADDGGSTRCSDNRRGTPFKRAEWPGQSRAGTSDPHRTGPRCALARPHGRFISKNRGQRIGRFSPRSRRPASPTSRRLSDAGRCSTARRTSSIAERTPSFFMRLARRISIARVETSKRAATALLGSPSRMASRTSQLLVGQARRNLARIASRSACSAVAVDIVLDGPLDLLQEGLAVERLLDELDRARLHRPDRHRHVRERRDEDDRHSLAPRDEILVQVEPTRSRHTHVKDEAAGPPGREPSEELVGGGERLDPEAHGLQEPLQRVPHVGIVVDDVDRGFRHRPLRPRPTRQLEAEGRPGAPGSDSTVKLP